MVVLWLMATMAGCSGELTQESFIDRYAKESCKALQECERSFFLDEYGDLDECREEIRDVLDDIFDEENCDFEPEEGQRCLDGFVDYRKSCDYDDVESDNCADAFGCTIETTTPRTYYYSYTDY
jgi:hypothetical protein